jgi:hypothetical protein
MTRLQGALRGTAVLFLVAGITTPANAATTIRVQVSRALAEDWHSSLAAQPGDSVDIRVLVSWTGGPVTPLGLSSVVMQPTVSRWAAGIDTLAPFVNNGSGSQNTTPIGAVADLPGQYGRIMPFAAISTFDAPNRGHVNSVSGITYLRIARSNTTAWFGATGNTTGAGGVNIHQFSQAGADRLASPNPPFSAQLTDIVVFKFNIQIGAAGPSLREMVCNVPLQGLNLQPNPYVGWYANPTEPTGSIRDLPTIIPAFINVPAPGGLLLPAAALAGLAMRRRRR